jgi:hypothetical protein
MAEIAFVVVIADAVDMPVPLLLVVMLLLVFYIRT